MDEYERITREHIEKVGTYINIFSLELDSRVYEHDKSKLEEPEMSAFRKITHLLSESTYGSDEYNEFLKILNKDKDKALDHHYKYNSHHPEHFKNGISGMTLADLDEMFCDWLAASKRHKDGNIFKSIRINKERFSLPEEIVSIFENTAREIYAEREKK